MGRAAANPRRRRAVQIEVTPTQMDALILALSTCTSLPMHEIGLLNTLQEDREKIRVMDDLLDGLKAIRDGEQA